MTEEPATPLEARPDEPARSLETERKYDVPEPAELPGFAGIAATTERRRFLLRATYFDTADDRLAAARITFRRREGGSDAGWHLKTPGTGGRVEHTAPLTDDAPPALLALAGPFLGGAPLEPIARLDTDRDATTLLDASGRVFAEIADDRVIAVDLRNGRTRTWREWEAELTAAAPADHDQRAALLDRIEDRLLTAGAAPSRSASKLAQATGRSTLGTADAGAGPA
ncbi:MAG: hypothetical protein JWP66_1550 [Naasia sp.]|nr:hypothetical protein [Naasia sp.]